LNPLLQNSCKTFTA